MSTTLLTGIGCDHQRLLVPANAEHADTDEDGQEETAVDGSTIATEPRPEDQIDPGFCRLTGPFGWRTTQGSTVAVGEPVTWGECSYRLVDQGTEGIWVRQEDAPGRVCPHEKGGQPIEAKRLEDAFILINAPTASHPVLVVLSNRTPDVPNEQVASFFTAYAYDAQSGITIREALHGTVFPSPKHLAKDVTAVARDGVDLVMLGKSNGPLSLGETGSGPYFRAVFPALFAATCPAPRDAGDGHHYYDSEHVHLETVERSNEPFTF